MDIMNEKQSGNGIDGIAEIIARKIISIRNLAAERGKPYPAEEAARQFTFMCERSMLRTGPLSTQHMALLASELVPEAIARLSEPERLAA
jgi:hypothetical protein